MATTSSGLTPLDGSWPSSFLTNSWIYGIRVDPPTRITLLISLASNLASFKASLTGLSVESNRSRHKSSNLALDKDTSICKGPSSDWVINGRDICAVVIPLKSFLAFSAASLIRCIAILSLDRSIPCSFLNSSTKYSEIFSSKSSPPKWLLPDVALTSNTPSPNSRIETSNVPPPKS